MPTAIGPQGPNFTTTRPPADPQASGGLDSWFKNCSAAGARDGTYATADFFNVVIAQLREAVRGMGIVLADTDDLMLLKAIQAAGGTASQWNVKVGNDIQSTVGKGTLPIMTA